MFDRHWCMERQNCERMGDNDVIIGILITDQSEVTQGKHEKIRTSYPQALGWFRTTSNGDILDITTTYRL